MLPRTTLTHNLRWRYRLQRMVAATECWRVLATHNGSRLVVGVIRRTNAGWRWAVGEQNNPPPHAKTEGETVARRHAIEFILVNGGWRHVYWLYRVRLNKDGYERGRNGVYYGEPTHPLWRAVPEGDGETHEFRGDADWRHAFQRAMELDPRAVVLHRPT